MSKKINLKDTVYEICSQYPEVKSILADLGFKDITKPVAMESLGRVMTLPKGSKIKDIPLDRIITTLEDAGFEMVYSLEQEKPAQQEKAAEIVASTGEMSRVELLKSYIQRLSAGEDLETVREDFVENFHSVEASEIAKAEQEIIRSGTPVEEVQRLCDVHSALFHGITREEQIGTVQIQLKTPSPEAAKEEKTALAYSTLIGHPVQVFMSENEILGQLLSQVRHAKEDNLMEELVKLRAVTAHYARKGDLIYPLLNRKYGFSGPSNVMWSVDDEIRDELRFLSSSEKTLFANKDRLEKLLTRAEEMIYKENHILLPLCVDEFSEEDWMRLYYEMTSYATSLEGGYPIWKEAEARRSALKTIGGKTAEALRQEEENDEKIILGSGHMTRKQIEAVLDTIPMELTFVDDQDINRYFNNGSKLFKRPDMAIDRDVFSCHPPKVEAMVREILNDFRAGRKDSVDVWMVKEEQPVLVRYMAVRDEEKNYVGTLECVQEMNFAKEHFVK